jgi:hypothetical protein
MNLILVSVKKWNFMSNVEMKEKELNVSKNELFARRSRSQSWRLKEPLQCAGAGDQFIDLLGEFGNKNSKG